MKNVNPLLEQFSTPYESVPFTSIKAEHFKPAFQQKLKETELIFKKVIQDKTAPTFKNTFIPIEKKYDEVSRLSNILFNLNSAETSDSIQAATQKISPSLTRFTNKLLLNKKYFKRVEKIYQNRTLHHLTSEEVFMVESTYTNMKRNGANLSFLKKLRLLRFQMQLSKLTLQFNENVLKETNQFEYHTLDQSELNGLSDLEMDAAAQIAQSKGKEGWIINLQFPSYGPFMKFAHHRSIREQIYKAYTSRCNHNNQYDNKKLIQKITNYRLKVAQILGYHNYGQLELEERMAKTPEQVNKFLADLHQASELFAHREVEELKSFAGKDGLIGDLMPWDFSYYSEKLKTSQYGFDENMIKPYFELNKVIEGVFGLATDLYQLRFKQVDNIPVYHTDVNTYEVSEGDGKFLAILYTDFHPRESKQGGAWMTEYRSQSNIHGVNIRPHISICCNFTKPTSNTPSLLTFNEVNTFLHEFGHALHGMLANTTYPSLSGTNVYQDFVELPSQIMENWITEIQWLKNFAHHYKTGAPIPEELIQKVIDARNFQAGYQSERQITFGMLDMAWHSINQVHKKEIISFENEHTEKTNLLPRIKGSCISTSFSHIFGGGYAAGYYSYKWAEVLDADAFAEFKKKGIFNQELALKFRNEILEKGGTVHPSTLYRNFKGNDPSIDALLKRSGLN